MSLWPPPRRLEQPDAAHPLVVPAGAAVGLEITAAGGAAVPDTLAGELQFAVAGLQQALANDARGLVVRDAGGNVTENGADIACRVFVDSATSKAEARVAVPTDESYCLRIDDDSIAIETTTPTGLFRAAATLKQWLASNGRQTIRGLEVAPVEIEDRPDFPIRGAMLDVSRNRVPTMEYLERLIDRLADWKVNHLQLYVEHTYAYEGHEDVWRHASPFTAAEIRSLDAYCRERFIELAPNQNSFGHFHRWLVHDRYRPLAEVPEGFRHPFSVEPEPFSLCATDPRVPELLGGLYDELLPQFVSRRFNVGLDETFDLGRGRSAEACAERGKPAVYLDFVSQVHGLVTDRDRQMLFWGDIILRYPELVGQIPDDAVALCWGYEANHPYADQCARLAASGREFWVCPGTSSWHSFGGRLQNAVSNLAAAAKAGFDTGARGLLVTDWGDYGHLQPPAIAELPLSIGTGFAWSVDAGRQAVSTTERNEDAWLEHASRFVYDGDDTLARTVVELGAIDLECGGPVMNGTTLFYLLRFIDEDLTHRRFARLTIARLQRTYTRLAEIRGRLAGASAYAALDWTCRIMAWCCRLGMERLGAGRGQRVEQLASTVRVALAAELRQIADDLTSVWLATSREGGLQESRALLLRAAAKVENADAGPATESGAAAPEAAATAQPNLDCNAITP